MEILSRGWTDRTEIILEQKYPFGSARYNGRDDMFETAADGLVICLKEYLFQNSIDGTVCRTGTDRSCDGTYRSTIRFHPGQGKHHGF